MKLQARERSCPWVCGFSGIKTTSTPLGDVPNFEEMWFVVFSPHGLHFLRDDGALGLAAASRSRYRHLGSWLVIHGPSNELNTHVALKEILQQLTCRGCILLATVPFSEATSCSTTEEPVPLSTENNTHLAAQQCCLSSDQLRPSAPGRVSTRRQHTCHMSSSVSHGQNSCKPHYGATPTASRFTCSGTSANLN